MSVEDIKVQRANYATSGDDYRRRADRESWRMFSSHFYTAPESQPIATSPLVEVQAFTPDNEHGVVVSLGLLSPDGRADMMLSRDEARDVALMLLRAADDADRLVSRL